MIILGVVPRVLLLLATCDRGYRGVASLHNLEVDIVHRLRLLEVLVVQALFDVQFLGHELLLMAKGQRCTTSTCVSTMRRYFLDSVSRVRSPSPHAPALATPGALVLLHLILVVEAQ